MRKFIIGWAVASATLAIAATGHHEEAATSDDFENLIDDGTVISTSVRKDEHVASSPGSARLAAALARFKSFVAGVIDHLKIGTERTMRHGVPAT